MYVYYNYDVVYVTIDELYCENEDLSTAYKTIFKRECVNEDFCMHVVGDICKMERTFHCTIKDIIIIGNVIDAKAEKRVEAFRQAWDSFKGLRIFYNNEIQNYD